MARNAVAVSRVRRDPQTDHPALLAKFFRGLGDPTRIRILELLLECERTVGELVEAVRCPQGRVSSHLACLRWCGYVTAHPEGRFVRYCVADERVTTLLHVGRAMMYDNAVHIQACTRIDADGRASCN